MELKVEEIITTAKSDRATLNKVAKAINDEKIRIKKEVLKPFEDFENKCKELQSIITDASNSIDTQEKAFEEKEQKVIAEIHASTHPDSIEMESDLALIAVVGRGMKGTRGTVGRLFSALAHAHINVKMIDQGSSGLNIIIGVKNEDFNDAIKAIYDMFVISQLPVTP